MKFEMGANLLKSLFHKKPRFERRYSSRLKTHNLVLVTAPLGADTLMNLVDLSTAGIQFSSTHALPLHKLVNLKINLAELDHHVLVQGRVVWAKSAGRRSPLYRIGVSFVDLSQEAWGALHFYLNPSKAA